MQMTTYLSFDGQCEAAFDLYRRCLGGEMGPIFRYAESPWRETSPPTGRGPIQSMSLGPSDVMITLPG
jgi:PhnB protein